MDGYENPYPFDIMDWEIVCIGDEYYRMLRGSGHSMSDAPLTNADLDLLLDAYRSWKRMLDRLQPDFADRDGLMHLLHFDVGIELFMHRKLREQQVLKWIFEPDPDQTEWLKKMLADWQTGWRADSQGESQTEWEKDWPAEYPADGPGEWVDDDVDDKEEKDDDF